MRIRAQWIRSPTIKILKTKLVKHLAAYALWILTLLLGIWFWFLGRSTLMGLLGMNMQGSILQVWRGRLADKVFSVVVGFGWLIMMIATESYFRDGAEEGDVLLRFAKIAGIELCLIFLADFILLILQGFGGQDWRRWLALIAELIGGTGLTYWGHEFAKPSSNQEKEGTPSL